MAGGISSPMSLINYSFESNVKSSVHLYLGGISVLYVPSQHKLEWLSMRQSGLAKSNSGKSEIYCDKLWDEHSQC